MRKTRSIMGVMFIMALLVGMIAVPAAATYQEEDPEPFVRITYICQAEVAGVAAAYDGSGFQNVPVNSGDHIWRFRNEGDVSVTYTTNSLGMSGSLDPGDIEFLTTSSGQNGVNVSTVPGPNGYGGTASVSGAKCEVTEEPEVPEEPVVPQDEPRETNGVRLVKFWYDADGNRVSAPEGDWSVTLNTATVNADQNSAWAQLSGANYSVEEHSTPEGWSEVSCDTVTLSGINTEYLDNSGTGQFRFPSGASEGAHAICNQADAEEEPKEVVRERPEGDYPVESPWANGFAALFATGAAGLALSGGLMFRRRLYQTG